MLHDWPACGKQLAGTKPRWADDEVDELAGLLGRGDLWLGDAPSAPAAVDGKPSSGSATKPAEEDGWNCMLRANRSANRKAGRKLVEKKLAAVVAPYKPLEVLNRFAHFEEPDESEDFVECVDGGADGGLCVGASTWTLPSLVAAQADMKKGGATLAELLAIETLVRFVGGSGRL